MRAISEITPMSVVGLHHMHLSMLQQLSAINAASSHTGALCTDTARIAIAHSKLQLQMMLHYAMMPF